LFLLIFSIAHKYSVIPVNMLDSKRKYNLKIVAIN
jgi:hypothetical protein